jgi:hypothetical protein
MKLKINMAAPLLVGVSFVIATPAPAGADPSYVAMTVGYQATGAPQGMPYVSTTAAGAQQGATQNCRAHLVACAPAGTSTQCIGIAISAGTKWMSAEGPDKRTAEANARAKLAELIAGLPLPDTAGLDPATTVACAWDQ